MSSAEPLVVNTWNEDSSKLFIAYGRYFVPDRERQIQTIIDLVPGVEHSVILELACGEGLLAEALLEQIPDCRVIGLDGSTEMLNSASKRLARFGERFQAQPFDLFSKTWRTRYRPDAVISSLALHHLDSEQKQEMMRDISAMLAPNGVLVIADIIEPAHVRGWALAATAWDEAVRERALALDGNLNGAAFFEQEHWNTYRYFDPADIDKPSRLLDQLKWMELAGFVDVDIHWMRAGHAIWSGWKR